MFRHLEQMHPPKYEQLFSNNDERKIITLFPRVIQTQPITVRGLLKSLLSILETLLIIHSKGIIHRDIRWANVGRSRGNESEDTAQWFLFDFDEAVGSHPLEPENHAPEINSPERVPATDVWGIGYLIKTVGLSVPEEVKDIRRRCLKSNPTLRPGVDVLFAEINSRFLSPIFLKILLINFLGLFVRE
jgi:serine/threonine protein kinase